MCLVHSWVQSAFIWIDVGSSEMWRWFHLCICSRSILANTRCCRREMRILQIILPSLCLPQFLERDTNHDAFLHWSFCIQHRSVGYRPSSCGTRLVQPIRLRQAWWLPVRASCNVNALKFADFGWSSVGADYTEVLPGVDFIRCFATYIISKLPAHIMGNCPNIWMNRCRYLQ